VPEPETSPLLETLRWLSAHAGFPAGRLPARAELLLLIATAAAEDERETARRQNAKPGAANTFNARLRSYTIQRRHAHVKCDNSVKV
jgi:hypothetical protein